MKTIDKIIESSEAPKDKNVLWVNGDKLLAMVKGKWTPVGGGSSDNVQGGGSSNQPSGGNNYVYLDWDAMKQMVSGAGYTPGQALVEFGGYAVTAKMKVADKVGIVSLAMTTIVALYYSDTTLDKISSSISALAVDLNVRIFEDGELMTVGEILGDGLANLPQITEEQFYNLEA